MRKKVCITLAAILVLSLTACGSNNDNAPSSLPAVSGTVSNVETEVSGSESNVETEVSGSENNTEISAPGTAKWQPGVQTERTQRAQATYQEVFGDMELSINEMNPDYSDIINNFIYGDVYNQSDLLDLRQRELITLVSLTANQSYDLLKQHVQGALNVGLTPDEILEAIYHTTPYAGIATTYGAVTAATEVLLENGVSLPLESQRQVNDGGRFEGGASIQAELYGMNPSRNGNHISEFVTEFCFGDFYSRGAVELKTRQLLTMCTLANLGLPQLSAHVQGSYNVGYSREEIVAAITQCMPYMGVPRTLNAISTVNQILDEVENPVPESNPNPTPGQ